MPGGKFTDSLITENLKVATEYFKTILATAIVASLCSSKYLGRILFKYGHVL